MREELDEGLGEDEYFMGSEEFDKVTICSRLDLTSHSKVLSQCALPQPLDVPFGFAANLECNISPIKATSDDSIRGECRERGKNLFKKKKNSTHSQPSINSPLNRSGNLNDRLASEVKRYEKMVEKLSNKKVLCPTFEESNFVLEKSGLSRYSSSPSVVEMSRHKVTSSLSHTGREREPDRRLTDEVFELTLDALEKSRRAAVYIDEAVQTEKRKSENITKLDKQTSMSMCHARYSEPCLSKLLKQKLAAPSKSEENKQFRGPLIDVDSVAHKGGVSNVYESNLKGASIAAILSGPKKRPPPRQPRTFSSSTYTVRNNTNEKPPFCSAVPNSLNGLTHAVHANEQLIQALVNSRFTHWKTLVYNILNDKDTGDDVAVRFLRELELRQDMKGLIHDENELNTYDLKRDDAKVIRMLKKGLSKSSTSRIQQLRILYSVLLGSL